MSHPKHADLAGLIEALLAEQVQFIVVGGAGAVLHGVLTVTQDLDVVHCVTPENVQRLQTVLDRLDACVRDPGHRCIRPDTPLLRSGRQLNLITALGPLDLLGRLHDGRGYDELLPTPRW